jgi:hypothetical protein
MRAVDVFHNVYILEATLQFSNQSVHVRRLLFAASPVAALPTLPAYFPTEVNNA